MSTVLHGTFGDEGPVVWGPCPVCAEFVTGYEVQVREQDGGMVSDGVLVQPCGCKVDTVEMVHS